METKAVNTVRVLSVDQVQAANSGHPGAPLGCAPMAHVLFTQAMKYDPASPKWINRDRFVLSNGHACALLYSMLHLTGFDLSMEQLRQFRQLDAVTAGHPENVLHEAIEVSTGPLGQGISNAVGLAIAQRQLAATYNKPDMSVFDNHTFVICGDGCLQEGVSGEACSLAGHLGLGNLIVLYDDNHITIDGGTDLSFTEDVGKRYEAYGWQVLSVPEGDSDVAAIAAAVAEAKADTERPTIIKVTTTIGFGSAKAGTAGVHGSPLGPEGVAALKESFGFDPAQSFAVEDDVREFYLAAGRRAAEAKAAWDGMFAQYKAQFPEAAAEIERRFAGELPADWKQTLPDFTKKEATRSSSGKVIGAVWNVLPELIGGSADLTPSNKTLASGAEDFQKATPAGRYMRFGVREHGMAAILNGMAAYGGIVPFGATFLNFIGYAAGAVRVGALSHRRVIYVATHDSIGLGEDGPTHQPVELVSMLRAMPNLLTFRPADGAETNAAYISALEAKETPSVLCLSRQNLPQLEGSSVEKAQRGAYAIFDTAGVEAEGAPTVLIVATGSEVELAIEAAKAFVGGEAAAAGAAAAGGARRVRVVSMPCWEQFEAQSAEYRLSVLPEGVPVVSVEAMSTMGWAKYSHVQVGLDRFGLSAPAPAVFERLGFTPAKVVESCELALSRYGASAPRLPGTY